jgi:hypothetical protein
MRAGSSRWINSFWNLNYNISIKNLLVYLTNLLGFIFRQVANFFWSLINVEGLKQRKSWFYSRRVAKSIAVFDWHLLMFQFLQNVNRQKCYKIRKLPSATVCACTFSFFLRSMLILIMRRLPIYVCKKLWSVNFDVLVDWVVDLVQHVSIQSVVLLSDEFCFCFANPIQKNKM